MRYIKDVNQIAIICNDSKLSDQITEVLNRFMTFWKIKPQLKIYDDYMTFLATGSNEKTLVISTDEALENLQNVNVFSVIKQVAYNSRIIHIKKINSTYNFDILQKRLVNNFIQADYNLELSPNRVLHQIN